MTPLLCTRRLNLSVPGKPLCRELELQVRPGQCWGILGPNGVGKSSLLHVLAGLVSPDSGVVLLEGHPIETLPRREVARRVGVLFQEQSDPFPATVLETALAGRYPFLDRWRWESEQDLRLVHQRLSQVGLAAMAARQVSTLSGGERQRLAVATLLAQQPSLSLLDEPVSHLDVKHQIEVLDLVTTELREKERAVVMVLHDVNLAARYCDHLLLLYPGGEAWHGETEEVLDVQRLSRLYGHPMTTLEGPRGAVYLPA